MSKGKWDKYFFDICNTVASNSKCLSRQIGAVIVRDKSIVSTGYNGAPRGVPSCDRRYFADEENGEPIDIHLAGALIRRGIEITEYLAAVCPRQTLGFNSGEGLEWCVAGHAERNAIVNAARLGVSTMGSNMYMNCPIPCTPCLVEIINAGISEIIVTKLEHYDKMSNYLITERCLNVRKYSF